jgi:hypothetical protein
MRAETQMDSPNRRSARTVAIFALAMFVFGISGCSEEFVDSDLPSDSIESQGEEGTETEPVRYGKDGKKLDTNRPHNPHCGEINPEWFQCKIEPVETGKYSGYKFADYEEMTEEQKAVCDSLTFKLKTDDKTFDWTTKHDGSAMGVDAICVKGGPGANCYFYNKDGKGEAATYDKGLNAFHETEVGRSGKTELKEYGLSHVTVCVRPQLDVKKTAKPIWKKIYDWKLKKLVKPDTWKLFKGDTGKSQYTVKAKRTKSNKYAVRGKVLVENNTPYDAIITKITDKIHTKYGKVSPKLKCRVKDGNSAGTFSAPNGDSSKYTKLEKGEKLVCRYKKEFGEKNPCGEKGCVNKVKVETKPGGSVQGGKAKAGFEFTKAKTTGKKHLKVKDSNGEEWTFKKSGKRSYKKTFDCSTADFKDGYAKYYHRNKVVAYNGKKKLKDVAKVTVHCYKLKTKKSAKATFKRRFLWDIDKTADPGYLKVYPYDKAAIDYRIKVATTGHKDGRFKLAGDIYIKNPHPKRSAKLVKVLDKFKLNGEHYDAKVTCPKYKIAPQSVLKCSYKAHVPKWKVDKGDEGINKAKIIQRNHDLKWDRYKKKVVKTKAGKKLYKAFKKFSFDKMRAKIDKCVKVTDSQRPEWSTKVCKRQSPEKIDYTKYVKYTKEQCGEHKIKNTAYFKTKDTKTKGEDSAKVKVEVKCGYEK